MSQTGETTTRLDLLVQKQVEIDELQRELDRVRREHVKELRDLREAVTRQKAVLRQTALICRGLMERPEIFEVAAQVANHLVAVREELGPDAPDPDEIYGDPASR